MEAVTEAFFRNSPLAEAINSGELDYPVINH